MATEYYNKAISEISEYYGVSKICSMYLYHRALRSKRSDSTYMMWNVKLQNALVKADKCIGLDWNKILFGNEEENLRTHGISVDEMSETVFKWVDDDVKALTSETTEDNDGWQTVIKKKKNKNPIRKYNFTYAGLFV